MLIIIVVVAFILRMYNINYNTAFLDEAQYITEGLKILSGNIESGIGAVSWIGGSPFMFPMLSALFYAVGGLIGSRLFMVILGTVCVYLMYLFTKELLFFKTEKSNERAGLIAAAFMAVTTIAIITSRLAIYDGLAFTLFLLGIVIFHRAIYSGERRYYLIASVVFFLSFLAKYIVLIFFPFLLLVPLLLAIRMKSMRSLKGVSVYFCLPFILLTGLYIGINFTALSEFFVNQGVVSRTSFSEVFRLFWEYTVVTYILCFLGLAFLWKHDKPLILLLLFFSALPLIVHGITGNDSSVQQHTFLSLIFALPVLGAIGAALIQKRKLVGKVLLVIALGIQVLVTMPQVQSAENFWPNLTEASTILNAKLQPNDRVLAESGDSLYLEISDKIAHEQIEGPFVFSYDEKEGREAYVAAINNGYFRFVQLDDTYFSEEDIASIEQALVKNYKKMFDDGSTRVFELTN